MLDCFQIEIENLTNFINDKVFAVYISITRFNCLRNIIKYSQTTDYIQIITFLTKLQQL